METADIDKKEFGWIAIGLPYAIEIIALLGYFGFQAGVCYLYD